MSCKASIIVLTFNNLEYTRLCLESIFKKTEGLNYEVIVVDNASSDGTPSYLQELAAQHPTLRLIMNSENLGFARGNNLGATQATGEYLVFLNNDVVVTRGWLAGLLQHLQDPEVGMVGPVTNASGNESRIEAPYQDLVEMDAFAESYTRLRSGQAFEVSMMPFQCVAIPARVFHEIGSLDERFGIGMFEDDDYALRLRQKGYRILCAEDVYVHHFGSASFSLLGIASYWQLFKENRAKFEEKWGIRWQPHLYRRELIPQQLSHLVDQLAWFSELLHERDVKLDSYAAQLAELTAKNEQLWEMLIARDRYIADVAKSRPWIVGNRIERAIQFVFPAGSFREKIARAGIRRLRLWRSLGMSSLLESGLSWAFHSRIGRAMSKPLKRLAPESVKQFYQEFQSEYPLRDRSQVILFADSSILPTYTPRQMLKGDPGESRREIGVTLIATTRNEARSAETWLNSLMLQSRLPDEAVIVDGGSTDRTVEILRTFAHTSPFPLKVIEAPGANIAQGRNIAIRNANHPIIACTDFGCILDKDWLTNIIRPFEIDEQIELSAGFYQAPGHTTAEKLFARFFVPNLASLNPQTFLPSSRSLAMKKSFWARVGGYPEWLSDAGEDTLFDFIAKSQPSKWAFAPQAVVSWNPPGTFSKLMKIHYRYSRGDGEAGMYASLYWRKLKKQIWFVASLGLFLWVSALSLAFLGPWGWLLPSVLLILAGLRFLLHCRHVQSTMGLSFSQACFYLLISVFTNYAQILGFTRGVMNRPAVRQNQMAFYCAQLQEILQRHPQRKGIVVYPPTHDWGFMFQRPHQMARAFAQKGYLYFFCTNNEKTDAIIGFQEVAPLLYVCHVPLQVFGILEKPIVYIGSPWHRSVLPLFNQPQVIYDHYDDLEVSTARPEDHESLLQFSDVVLATSRRLFEAVRRVRSDVIYTPNGVDYQYVQAQSSPSSHFIPPDLIPIMEKKHPIIGYSGALAQWFDYTLLSFLAQERPEYEFVLIGVSYDGSLEKSGVLDLKNVHWLGMKPYEQIFTYIGMFDVATIPFLVNNITLSTSPIKLFEYMACQKPVVSTALPEVMNYPGVLIAHDPSEFAAHLEQALHMKEDGDYRALLDGVARENTWENRVDAVLHRLNKIGVSSMESV